MRSTCKSSLRWCAIALAFAATGCGDDGGSTSAGSGGSGGGRGGNGGGNGSGGQGGDPSTTVVASSSASIAVASSSAQSSASTGSGEISCPAGGYASFNQTECDMLQQDCDPGFTCERRRVGGVTVTRCVERGGLKGIGSVCNDDDECESGLFCVFDVCTPVCCPANDEPCDGGNCNLNVQFSNGDSVEMCTYSKQCTPFAEDACPSGSGCHFEEPEVSTCIQNNGTPSGDGGVCTVLNDCGDMLQCLANDLCRFICMLEDEGLEPGRGGCPAGQTCRNNPSVAITGLGVCDPD